MKTKTKLVSIFLLLALLLAPTVNVHAQSPGGDVVLFGKNYTLKSGETLNGSVVVFGGNVTIEKDAKVTRDVVLFGGNLVIDGNVSGSVVLFGGNLTLSQKVSGDVVVFGGQIMLQETAVVKGDVVTFGGQVTQEEGAEIAGNIIDNLEPPQAPTAPTAPNAPALPDESDFHDVDAYDNPVWQGLGVLMRALGLAAIAMLLALFLQPQMERVSDAVVKQPLLAGSFGLLVVVLTPLAILVMVITIILIPVALLVLFIIPLAWMFGMISLGQEIGERFTKAINQIWSPVLSTGFGTFLLMLVVGALGLIPCAGWLLSFLVTLLALGGVVMTWFGARSAPAKPSAPAIVVEEVPPAS